MKAPVLLILSFASVLPASGQQDTWDVAATEVMIKTNKRHYSDHKEATTNQLASQASVATWKVGNNRLKNLADLLDSRLTSAAIVAADATTLYNIYRAVDEMITLQQQALRIAYKYPWLAPMVVQHERKIIDDAQDLASYITLLVLSYGELSKMKVAARKTLFHEIDLQLRELTGRCHSLYYSLKAFDAGQQIKNTRAGILVNRDAQLIKDILNKLK